MSAVLSVCPYTSAPQQPHQRCLQPRFPISRLILVLYPLGFPCGSWAVALSWSFLQLPAMNEPGKARAKPGSGWCITAAPELHGRGQGRPCTPSPPNLRPFQEVTSANLLCLGEQSGIRQWHQVGYGKHFFLEKKKNPQNFLGFFFAFREYIFPKLSLGMHSWPWGLWRGCFTLRKGGKKVLSPWVFHPCLQSAHLSNEGPSKGERHLPAPDAPLIEGTNTHLCFTRHHSHPLSLFVYLPEVLWGGKKIPPPLKFHLTLNICPKNISL